MLSSLLLGYVAATGTVKLHVTDAHGKPMPNREIWLAPTNSTKPVRTFGDLYWLPDTKFRGRTDAEGNVAIAGITKRKPMMVLMRFGPRFEPYIRSKHRDGPSVDMMKLDGAVFAGKPARLVFADDYVVKGRITDSATGSPLADVPVFLSDTMFGHMSGYPGTDLDETNSDANGEYAFTRLPNCAFQVLSLPKPPRALEARVDRGSWQFVHVDAGKGIAGYLGWNVVLKQAQTSCDFRVSLPATVTINVKKGNLPSLNGWVAWIGYDYSGFGLEGAEQKVWHVLPGTHTVSFKRQWDREFVAETIRLRPGEKRTLVYTLSDVIKRNRRRR